jgi:hypothetical protein
MTCNMGKGDRMFRGILGIVILAAGLYFQSWWGFVGLIPLVTSAFAWCPAYVPFKFNTGAPSDS